MKRVAKPVFFIVALLIIALSCMAFFGVHGRNGDIPVTYIKGLNDIRWGIDIKGGVEATFSPADGVQATREDMESAKAIIELRMVNNNITDYELSEGMIHLVSGAEISLLRDMLDAIIQILVENDVHGASYCSECGKAFTADTKKKIVTATDFFFATTVHSK